MLQNKLIMFKYKNIEKVNLIQEFTEKELKLLNKFGIILNNKKYTEYEFDIITGQLGSYYLSDDELVYGTEECVYELPDGISREVYNKLLEKINKLRQLFV